MGFSKDAPDEYSLRCRIAEEKTGRQPPPRSRYPVFPSLVLWTNALRSQTDRGSAKRLNYGTQSALFAFSLFRAFAIHSADWNPANGPELLVPFREPALNA